MKRSTQALQRFHTRTRLERLRALSPLVFTRTIAILLPEESALVRLALALLFALISGCATVGNEYNQDPFEEVNRAVFAFNDSLDRSVLAPAARGYRRLTPDMVERGIGNFFANLRDANSAVNALLQGRFESAAKNSWRFAVNTTFGLAGFMDIGSHLGVEPYRTDFGHTLAVWGADPGPYLMLPLLGPRTVRSGVGTAVDMSVSAQWMLDGDTRDWLFPLELIDGRAALIVADELITGDRYIFVREAYLQQRGRLTGELEYTDAFSSLEDEDFDWSE